MLDIVLDSGAFSAWTKKTNVDIDAYARFMKDNCQYFDHAVNLDRIPGEFGRVPTPDEVEASAAEGFDNYLFLRDIGLDTQPVFHMGEQFKWLDRMVEAGCKYIGISPANDRTTDQKKVWLDQVFSRLVDRDGYPLVKTHGFGVTSIPILFRYPWYSADSTSWVLFGAYGMILVPQWKGDEFDYSQGPHSVVVSKESKSRNVEGKHFDTFNKSAQEHIEAYVRSCGLEMADVRDHYLMRARVNATFFKRIGECNYTKPFKLVTKGFLDHHLEDVDFDRKPLVPRWEKMKLIFAASDSPQHSEVLNDLQIQHRLLSYYYIKDAPQDFLEVYSRDGIYYRKPKLKKVKPNVQQSKPRRPLEDPESGTTSVVEPVVRSHSDAFLLRWGVGDGVQRRPSHRSADSGGDRGVSARRALCETPGQSLG